MNLKDSADSVLARNRSRNRSATDTKKGVQPIDPLIASVHAVTKGLSIGCVPTCAKTVENSAVSTSQDETVRKLVALEGSTGRQIPRDLEQLFNRAVTLGNKYTVSRVAEAIERALGGAA